MDNHLYSWLCMGLLPNQRLILQVNQPQYPVRSRSYVQGFFMLAHKPSFRLGQARFAPLIHPTGALRPWTPRPSRLCACILLSSACWCAIIAKRCTIIAKRCGLYSVLGPFSLEKALCPTSPCVPVCTGTRHASGTRLNPYSIRLSPNVYHVYHVYRLISL